ncbi:MAG TPA: hypothetical protein VK568_16560 [Thermodesulfobacteriota bacterium]|nr:hypothetical protein [Thermodesulfobacteriota bacterium]
METKSTRLIKTWKSGYLQPIPHSAVVALMPFARIRDTEGKGIDENLT